MNTWPLMLVWSVCTAAIAQQNQAEAFDQGKAYRQENERAARLLSPTTADETPGRDPTQDGALTGLYGHRLTPEAEAKTRHCASAGIDGQAYSDQECAAINYLARNPEDRPRTVVSRSEPAVEIAVGVRRAPRVFTADQPGLSGTYTACVDRTTRTPLHYITERCAIGHPVTEGQCVRRLSVAYHWAPYSGQPGAEVAYSRCAPPTVRGDQLSLPEATTYRDEPAACASLGFGTGTAVLFTRLDCDGRTSQHGYDARGCSNPPLPAIVDPPRSHRACTDVPRTATHCFHADGRHAGVAQVPVFEDIWDDSDCAAFDRARGEIAY